MRRLPLWHQGITEAKGRFFDGALLRFHLEPNGGSSCSDFLWLMGCMQRCITEIRSDFLSGAGEGRKTPNRMSTQTATT
jgi:hypothetical protein